jgi:hypothetical protein
MLELESGSARAWLVCLLQVYTPLVNHCRVYYAMGVALSRASAPGGSSTVWHVCLLMR